jgi:hypothetical protein
MHPQAQIPPNAHPGTIRIFLACSNEMREEIESFADIVRGIGNLPHVRRTHELVPVHWEDSAYGGNSGEIDETIRHSVDFEGLDLVIVGVWNRLGDGTRGEYELARSLWRVHRRPQVLCYFRQPDEGADPTELQKIQEFKEQLIRDGVVPTGYSKSRGTPLLCWTLIETAIRGHLDFRIPAFAQFTNKGSRPFSYTPAGSSAGQQQIPAFGRTSGRRFSSRSNFGSI